MCLTLDEAALIVQWGCAVKEISGDRWRAEEQALMNRLERQRRRLTSAESAGGCGRSRSPSSNTRMLCHTIHPAM